MSSNCPPQLHLELPPNTTSFKRSFDQFGFDLESPLGGPDGGGSSGSDGNDRNKRARSASSFSDDSVSIGSSSSTLNSSSSSSSDSAHAVSQSALAATARPTPTLGAPHLSLNLARSSLGLPGIPTSEIQDIDMEDYPLVEDEEEPSTSTAPTVSQADDSYRLSLERFNAFDTQISALRRSRSPSLPRSSTPPPVLPPLELLGEEAQITTNTISFLQPPAQPSPPLPNSLYGFGLPRTQRLASGTVGRDEGRQNDPRRLPHESHSQGESSRGLADDLSHDDEVWNRDTHDVRSTGARAYQAPWSYWPPSAELEHDNDEDALPQPLTVRSDSPVPAIGELRSPSPLFDDLDELQPTTRTRRASEHTPPTLPPIQDHDESWEDPLESLRMFSWNGSRPQSSSRATQPPSLSRISIPRDILSSHEPTEENHSTGPAAAASSSDSNAQSHPLPSVFARELAGWLDDDSAHRWFSPSAREESNSSPPPRSTNNASSSDPPSGNNGASSSALLDSYTASRLEALHGIGEALQGIGRVLQESEMTLRPFLMDTSSPVENSGSSGSIRSSSRGNPSTEARTSGWRSITGSSTNAGRSEANQDNRESSAVPRWLRLSAPSLPSPLEDHMRPWLADSQRRSREASPPPAIEPWMSFDELRDLHTRYPLVDRLRQASTSREPVAPQQSTAVPVEPMSPNEDEGDLLASSWFGAANAASVYTSPRHPSGADATSTRNERQYAVSSQSPADPAPRSTASPWTWPENTTVEVREYSTPDVITSTVHRIREDPSPARVDTQTTSDRYPVAGSSSRTADTRPTHHHHRIRYHGHSSNRSMGDAALFAARPATTDPSASSSSAATTSYVSTPSLLRLRSRPYVSQSSTHTHAHSHSLSSVRGDDPPASFSESASDARRRIARLGLMQMQRQTRTRTPSTEAPAVPTWIPHSHETNLTQPPPRPRRVSPHRITPFSQLLAEERERARMRTVAERHRDGPSGLSSAASSNLFDVAVDLDRDRHSRPSNTRVGTAPPERLHRPGLRLAQRSYDRFGESVTSAGDQDSSDDIDLGRLRAALQRDFGSNRAIPRRIESSTDRERNYLNRERNYLPVPSLPSPDLDGVFDFTPSTSHSTATRNFEQRPSSAFSGRVTSSSVRRSPSPISPPEGLRRRHWSPVRPTPPPSRPVRRDLNPESFAPGPFRNTIQRFYEARNRVGGSQTQTQTQSQSTYVPPSIPPLAFEEEDFATSMYTPDRQEGMSDERLQAFLNYYADPGQGETTQPPSPDENPPSLARPRHWFYDDDHNGLRPRPVARPSNTTSTTASETSGRPSDLHNFLSRRPRMEASRLDNPDDSRPSASRGDEDGFTEALEVLRHDGLSIPRSQELITRYHRERQRTFTAPASPWGIIQEGSGPSRRTSETTTGEPPAPRTWRRARENPFSFDNGEDDPEASNRDADRVRFARARRLRRPNFEFGPVFPHGVREFIGMGGARRGRPLGDYMRDEDFDESYESLLSLAASLGEAKPRCTPDSVIAGLETGLYKDWKTADSDHRCPICLDDYQAEDGLLKLADCSHWLHRECLHQWLRSASTCPVCRKTVGGRRGHYDPSSEAGPSRRRGNPRNGPGGSGGNSNGNTANDGPGIGEWMPPWRYGQGE